MAWDLPRTLTLPSGRRVTVRAARAGGDADDVLAAALAADVELTGPDGPVALGALALADFHVVAAVLAKAGRVPEPEEVFPCHNCGAELRVRPSAALETGPWEDGEADDPELDRTGPFGEPIGDVVLAPRTVDQARPALVAARPLRFTPALVRALGIERVGPRRTPARLARWLGTCSDEAFAAVADAWLDAHYPARLGADVRCPTCDARNTVDVPAGRELERGPLPEAAGGDLPDAAAFADRAEALAAPLLRAHPDVVLVVDDGTPAVDDGGEPLLGSYLPPPDAGATGVPTRPPTITVYFQTFLAAAREEPDFDWEDELRETLEHELEHHVNFLLGDDPLDAEERAALAREELRLVGRREAERRALGAFAVSLADFARRAWPLFVLAALVLAITIGESRCAE